MSKRVTTADFIQRAREVHGDWYDYSKVLYVAAKIKVTIICPEHGEFEHTPTNHYTGYGFPGCGGNKPLTLNRFVERANKIHKDCYDYSRVAFIWLGSPIYTLITAIVERLWGLVQFVNTVPKIFRPKQFQNNYYGYRVAVCWLVKEQIGTESRKLSISFLSFDSQFSGKFSSISTVDSLSR